MPGVNRSEVMCFYSIYSVPGKEFKMRKELTNDIVINQKLRRQKFNF